jgi:7,8-dihydropterin-6-yl-methyl-4-(beta-D-ribofuranosyl)aminobenzene 5'-phosphate synthase
MQWIKRVSLGVLVLAVGLPVWASGRVQAQQVGDEDEQELTITILYDNNPYNLDLQTSWGFSALVEYRDHTVLFDTGGDGDILLSNMAEMDVDIEAIEAIVLSHQHGDHVGGLAALLEQDIQPPVYVLESFPSSIKRAIDDYTDVIESEPGQEITSGIYTTGMIDGSSDEQALVIESPRGLVVITGCAHPGIAQMVADVQALFDGPVYLVLGGFHLGSRSEAQITAILGQFRELEVANVAPSHCTGAQAIAMFEDEYEDNFMRVGAGKVITILPASDDE